MYINRQIRFVGDAQRQQQTAAHGLHHLSRLTAGRQRPTKLSCQTHYIDSYRVRVCPEFERG